MNQQEAEKLIAQIQREMPQVEATIGSKKANQGVSFFVHLFLPTPGLSISINYVDDWPSIKDAWQWFLPGAEYVEESQPETKYLVDGIEMYIRLRKNGYWYGMHYVKNVKLQKYFGRVDPRPKYQEVGV